MSKLQTLYPMSLITKFALCASTTPTNHKSPPPFPSADIVYCDTGVSILRTLIYQRLAEPYTLCTAIIKIYSKKTNMNDEQPLFPTLPHISSSPRSPSSCSREGTVCRYIYLAENMVGARVWRSRRRPMFVLIKCYDKESASKRHARQSYIYI